MQDTFSCEFEYSAHKGIQSTNLIIGGSSLYTGAPYFTSLASLRSGFDLSYIMSQDDAIIPLKTLLPESIILPIKKIDWILNKINVCILGPGLDRVCDKLIDEIKEIIKFLIKRNVFIIIDGDGLFILKDLANIIDEYSNIILTPNYNEKKKLYKNKELYVIEKGVVDKCYFNDMYVEVSDVGCEKRCGGLGDILCAILAILLVWNGDNVIGCMYTACRIMRKASNLAFRKKGRGLMARDVIDEIVESFEYFKRIH